MAWLFPDRYLPSSWCPSGEHHQQQASSHLEASSWETLLCIQLKKGNSLLHPPPAFSGLQRAGLAPEALC